MTSPRTVVLELSRLEGMHLAGLVTQFAELLDASEDTVDDPAVARLVPDAYTDDPEAAREFRDVTQGELLSRRRTDAGAVLASLRPLIEETPTDGSPAESEEFLSQVVPVVLDPETLQSWLRALAAIRLVLASRLGIQTEEDHDDEDPRFGIYDWLGFRLDGLVHAASGD